MSGEYGLVSWDAPSNFGKIEGSDWVSPRGSLDDLEGVHFLGGEEVAVTEDDILVFANGRSQHLAMAEYPEGFCAASIIDSETGKVLTDSDSSTRYAGIIKCSCGQVHGSAVTSVLSYNPITLTDGRALTSVCNFSEGTQSVIKPIEVLDEPDFTEQERIERCRTGIQITPAAQKLFVYNQGRVGAIDKAHVDLDIRDGYGPNIPNAKFSFRLNDGYSNVAQINFDLDEKGQLTDLTTYRGGFVDALGVRTSTDISGEWTNITDTRDQGRVLDGLAEALGFDRWTGLDLKLTASGLYAAMGNRNLDPATYLIPA